MENFNEELMAKARAANSAKELMALAKENEIELSEQEANDYFEQMNKSGGLSDDELDSVAGGGCHKGDGRLEITAGHGCGNWACKYCGQKVNPSTHRCPNHVYKLLYLQAPGICKNCDFVSYEKGMWLCNHPANNNK